MLHPVYAKAGQRIEAEKTESEDLTPAQEIALLAQPYMPHDKWVELYEAIEKALGGK